MLDFNV